MRKKLKFLKKNCLEFLNSSRMYAKFRGYATVLLSEHRHKPLMMLSESLRVRQATQWQPLLPPKGRANNPPPQSGSGNS